METGDLFIVEPKEVSQFHGKDSSIAHVHTCDAATVVATTQVIFNLNLFALIAYV